MLQVSFNYTSETGWTRPFWRDLNLKTEHIVLGIFLRISTEQDVLV